MGVIDIAAPSVAAPIDTPAGFAVTPGLDDLDHGSEKPDRSVLGAAFRQDNSVGSFLSNEVSDSRFVPVDPNFKPWDKIKGTKYEAQWKSFVDVSNEAGLEQVKRQIDKEEDDRKTLAAAPMWQSLPAQILAGGIDWPTLLPGGSLVRGARVGYSVGRSAASVAGAAGFSTAVQEAALHDTQETRSFNESLLNIGGSMALGGLLGAGGAKLFSKIEWDQAVKALDEDLARVRSGGSSVGAAALESMDIEGNAIAGKMASAVASATGRLNPALRILQSPSPATRDIGTQLFEHSLYLKKNLEGVASEPAAETLMKEWNAGLARAVTATDDAFADYRKAGGPLNRAEFRDAIGRAMRRNDEADDPHITRAAKEWRSRVFDPLKDAAIKAKLLPEDVTVETAATYFSRMWNRNRLIAREPEFKGIVESWVGKEAPKWAEQFDKAAERRLAPLRNEIDELEMARLRRAEELRAREEGGEIEAGDFTESDIRSALRIVEGGAAKPKGVKTLTQFLHDQGGLADIGGELTHMGVTNRARPGFVRERDIYGKGGLGYDEAALRAWEEGYFPHHNEPPSINEFLEALGDDFHKMRAVLKAGDQDAYRLTELVRQLEADLNRVGAQPGGTNRFATSAEVRGIVARVYKALDAEADRKIAALRQKLTERETTIRVDRESRFVGDHKELGRQIADEVFDKLTGKTTEAVRPEFIKIKARGPLKERTFNIPDELIEDFLESDVDAVGRRYARVMAADVELARKFGKPDMTDQIQKIRDDYRQLRSGVADEAELKKLGDAETADVRDIEALRDLLRGTRLESPIERNYGRLMRAANMVNYIRSMGEVVLASLTDAVRPAMVHGLRQFMQTVPQLLTNIKAVKMSVDEAQLAGNVVETILGHRLATLSEIVDPYASRGPVEAFLENATNVASKWNGIRIWTDMMKSVASVMTQNRILANVADYKGVKPAERKYLAYLGVDESMAERIAAQFTAHGENIDGVRVANTESWTDPVAVRTYRAAMNKDVDSIIVMKGVADVPLFASTPTGRMLLQFKSFALASHQRILLRGLQEDQTRFLGGMVAMTAMGMAITYLKAASGNRTEKQSAFSENPGWWIAEGLDRSGVLSVPMELANTFERATGANPIKGPLKAFDQGNALSQKNQNRNEVGALLGPTVGAAQDVMVAGGIPKRMYEGEEVSQAQKNALERLAPFNSFPGIRQFLRYFANDPD